MATILDIILAMMVGGILLIIILNANQIAMEWSSVLNGDVLVQRLLISTAQIVEGEFRNMGVGVERDSATIMSALDTAISFRTDIGRDNILDRVDFWVGSVSELAYTQNDSDRFLYRRVNLGPPQAVGTVTFFRLRYFSQNQMDTLITPVPPSDLRMIKIVEISLEVQNPYALYKRLDDPTIRQRAALYSSSLWRQTRLASQNLRR